MVNSDVGWLDLSGAFSMIKQQHSSFTFFESITEESDLGKHNLTMNPDFYGTENSFSFIFSTIVWN